MALVGVEMHLAVGQGADRLAVLADIGDQHHRGVIAHELLGVDHRRRPELLCEANLVVLAQLLSAQQNDQVLMPGVSDLRENRLVELAAQVDPHDLGAECRRKRPYGKAGLTRHGLDASSFHLAAPSLPVVAAVAASSMIMGRAPTYAQGSFASIRTKAMRQGSVPRLTQA